MTMYAWHAALAAAIARMSLAAPLQSAAAQLTAQQRTLPAQLQRRWRAARLLVQHLAGSAQAVCQDMAQVMCDLRFCAFAGGACG